MTPQNPDPIADTWTIRSGTSAGARLSSSGAVLPRGRLSPPGGPVVLCPPHPSHSSSGPGTSGRNGSKPSPQPFGGVSLSARLPGYRYSLGSQKRPAQSALAGRFSLSYFLVM